MSHSWRYRLLAIPTVVGVAAIVAFLIPGASEMPELVSVLVGWVIGMIGILGATILDANRDLRLDEQRWRGQR